MRNKAEAPSDGIEEARSSAFGARSLALSLLLGSHPPRLPVGSLVAAGELFGVSGGAMRTALSRMSSAGEVSSVEGTYVLSGRLIERQARQDVGRRPVDDTWDGRWVTVTPRRSSRPLSDRREMRGHLDGLRLGELRPDYWLRPANVDLEPILALAQPFDLLVTVGELTVRDLDHLVNELWSLENLNVRAAELTGELEDLAVRPPVDGRQGRDDGGADNHWLVAAFVVAAEVVRFLTREPRLPGELVPSPWTPNRLRAEYDSFERQFQHRLAIFLRRATSQEDAGIRR
ncbi:MAG: PaaX domain-containing protein, C- domain protein [Acidimicrobiia bacterium]|nr:PaaX domain-containing protein, C- domain protein [Acidimicrobiia bacterium]